jgi:hypothetical protein
MEFKRYLKAAPIILRYPRTFFLVVSLGKVAAYKYLLSTILISLSAKPSGRLKYHLEDSARRGHLSLPDDLKLFERYEEIIPPVVLYYLCRVNKPRVVIETGVWTGKSTWFILKALSDNGRGTLFSIDLGLRTVGDETLPTNEIGGFVPKSLRDRWTLLIGDSKDVLPKLIRQIGRFDIFFHDSSHTYDQMLFEFRTVWPVIDRQGYLCSDDVSNNNAWIDFMNEIGHGSKPIGKRMGICCKNNSSVE